MEARSHQGAIRLFNTEFIRPGLFPSSHNRLIGGMQRAREMADYDASVAFSSEDAQAELDSARLFLGDAKAWLLGEGWLEPPQG